MNSLNQTETVVFTLPFILLFHLKFYQRVYKNLLFLNVNGGTLINRLLSGSVWAICWKTILQNSYLLLLASFFNMFSNFIQKHLIWIEKVNPFIAGTDTMLMQTCWIQVSGRVTRRLAWYPTCLLLKVSFLIKIKQILKVLKSRRHIDVLLEKYPSFKRLTY